MRKSVAGLLIVSCFVIFSGCATLFKGGAPYVGVTSDPTGAQVYVNGMNRGTTPVSLKLEPQKTYDIEFKKEGYATRTYHIGNKLGAIWIVLDVLGGGIPLIIDAATGNWMELDQDNINAMLERK